MRATTLWKQPRGWLAVLVGSLLAAVITLAYIGPASDPQAHVRDLPLVLVNADAGARAGNADVRLGGDVAARVEKTARRDGRVAWRTADSAAAAKELLASGEAYAGLVLPRDFSQKSMSLVAPGGRPERPTMTVLTNEGSGGVASSMAEKAARQTAAEVSVGLGKQLTEQTRGAGAKAAQKPDADRLLLLQDPVRTLTEPGQTTSGAAAGGSMTLYLTIAVLLAGLLPAILLTMMVDASLGYGAWEMGPRRTLLPLVRIARASTFAAKAGIGAVTGFAAGSAVVAVAVWGLDVQPDQPLRLWLFAGLACAAITQLTLALFAVFGMAGQVLALFTVTLLGVPLSGATIPVEAQPGFAAAMGEFLPARHVTEGVRSLLFFDGLGSGLGRAWVVLGGYAVGAFLVGFAVSRLYDRFGFDRATKLELAQPSQVPVPAAV